MDSVRLVHNGDSVTVATKRDKVTVTSSPVVFAPDRYAGPYELTPTLDGFDVETNMLLMEDDVTVKPIPINETTNPQEGYTVVIG